MHLNEIRDAKATFEAEVREMAHIFHERTGCVVSQIDFEVIEVTNFSDDRRKFATGLAKATLITGLE